MSTGRQLALPSWTYSQPWHRAESAVANNEAFHARPISFLMSPKNQAAEQQLLSQV
jgi:hypothetical protein